MFTRRWWHYVVRFICFLNFIFFGCARFQLLCEGFLWFWQAGPALCCSVQASVAVAHGLQSMVSVVGGTWAQLLCGMWNLSGLGIKALSSALAGGFLSTAPPGKSHSCILNCLSSFAHLLALYFHLDTHALEPCSLTLPCMQDQMVIAFYFAFWSPFLFKLAAVAQSLSLMGKFLDHSCL